jgi:hypothetical protein
MLRQIDDAHPPFAEKLEDSIIAYGLVNQSSAQAHALRAPFFMVIVRFVGKRGKYISLLA